MGVVDMWVGVADSAMGCGRSNSIGSTLAADDVGVWPSDEEAWPEDATFLLLELGC